MAAIEISTRPFCYAGLLNSGPVDCVLMGRFSVTGFEVCTQTRIFFRIFHINESMRGIFFRLDAIIMGLIKVKCPMEGIGKD